MVYSINKALSFLFKVGGNTINMYLVIGMDGLFISSESGPKIYIVQTHDKSDPFKIMYRCYDHNAVELHLHVALLAPPQV